MQVKSLKPCLSMKLTSRSTDVALINEFPQLGTYGLWAMRSHPPREYLCLMFGYQLRRLYLQIMSYFPWAFWPSVQVSTVLTADAHYLLLHVGPIVTEMCRGQLRWLERRHRKNGYFILKVAQKVLKNLTHGIEEYELLEWRRQRHMFSLVAWKELSLISA